MSRLHAAALLLVAALLSAGLPSPARADEDSADHLRLHAPGRLSMESRRTLRFHVAVETSLPREAVTLEATELPEGGHFDETTGLVTFFPTEAQTGTHRFAFVARAKERVAEAEVTVLVRTPPRALFAPRVDLAAISKMPLLEAPVHGFRLGYEVDRGGVRGPLERRTLHRFLLGYEAGYRIEGGGDLDVLFLGSATLVGLERSDLLVRFGGGLHFEIQSRIRLGATVILSREPVRTSRVALSAGFSGWAGILELPIELRFIPEPDGRHSGGLSLGVWW